MSETVHIRSDNKQKYEKENVAHWKEFACGWGAAIFNISLTYPVNKIIFRQMLHGVSFKRAFSQVYSEGIYFLYRGILPPLFQKTTSLSLMFGVYDECKWPLLHLGLPPNLAKALAGTVAGTVEATLMPLERVQTLLADSHYHQKYKNTMHTFRLLWVEFSFREYYRGLVPILLRNGPSNACFFILKDEIHSKMIPQIENPVKRTTAEFIAGALIGVILSTIFYPLNVIKIAMQRKVGGEFESITTVAVRVYEERGRSFRAIYQGLGTNCSRAFLSWGVMNAAYENLKKLLD